MRSGTETRTKSFGTGAVAVGLTAIALFPFRRFRTGSPAGEPAEGATFVAVLGICLVVWGVSTVYSNDWRSLTPRRALAVPLLAVAVVLATELLAVERVAELWSRPFPARIIVWQISAWLPMGAVGASTMPVVGSALRRRDPRWVASGVALTLVVTTLAATPYTAGMPLFVLVFGAVPGLFGYVATAPRARIERVTVPTSAFAETVPRTTAVGALLASGGCLFAALVYVSLTFNTAM